MPARPTPASTAALAAAVAALTAAIAVKQDAATAGTDAEIAAAKAEALDAAAAVQVEVDALEAAGATDVDVAAAVAVLAATVATDAELAAALTANSVADRARSNHTGEQAQATIVGLGDALAGKVAGTDGRLTDARAPTAHIHDDRYYTEAEAQALLAAKADLVGGVIPTSQVPAVATGQTVTVASQVAMLALTSTQAQPGDVAIRSDLTGRRFLLSGNGDASVLANWIALETPDAVSSVNSQQGAVVLGKADVGLGNIDNTADAGKPVSAAQQAALNARQPLDSDLTALAALSTTPFGRGLLEALDSSAARALLGASPAPGARTLVNPAGGLAPAFNAEWSNFGGAYEELGFFKWGVLVFLSGLVKKASAGVNAETIFTLPSEVRPSSTVMDIVNAGSAVGRIDIRATGAVGWYGGSPTGFFAINSFFRVA